jgi:general secretion pathway protein G
MTNNGPRFSSALARRGFSLLEIIVAVVILSILATMVAVNVFGNIGVAKTTKAQSDIKSLSTALDMYRIDNFTYPSTEQGLNALLQKPSGQPESPNWRQGGYLSSGEPRDPWNRPYQYLQPGQHGAFDIYTLGADGKPGGDGENADIGNWNAKS